MTADMAGCFSRSRGTNTSEAQGILPLLYTYQNPPQKRRKPTDRRPKFYWQSIDNVRLELASFWVECGVHVDQSLPPIPNEKILNFFGLNGLRWAIAQLGGRENVARQLGGVLVIPGKWEEAKELDEVKRLLPYMANYTTNDDKEKGDKRKDARKTTSETIFELAPRMKCGSTAIKTNYFWSKENAIKELYRYLESYKVLRRRPSVWMPKVEEVKAEGFLRLFNALNRFNKLPSSGDYATIFSEEESVRHVAGLVPFQEWRCFESQLQFLVELRRYLELYHGGDEIMPEDCDNERLQDLMRMLGGKVLLSQKYSLPLQWETRSDDTTTITASGVDFGLFSLEYAIELLCFVRSSYLDLSPPLASPQMRMPSIEDLRRCGRNDLADQTIEFGGLENVARRLGLAYGDISVDEERYKAGRMMWRQRGTRTGLESSFISDGFPRLSKEKGVAWNEDLVKSELLIYIGQFHPSSIDTMPRLVDIESNGRQGLRNAISKFGGKKYFAKKLGLRILKNR